MVFVPLKRKARIQYGLGQPPQLAQDGVAIIRATNIFRGRIVANDLIRARVEDLPLDRAPLLKPGEVLVVRSGAYTGDSALITPEWAGSAPGYDLRVTPGDELESRFLAYTMLGHQAMDEIDLAKSRAAQPHLNAEDLGQVGVLDAPISMQQKIADYLDHETARIDALIEAKQQMIELLQERRSSLRETLVSEARLSESAIRLGYLLHEVDERLGSREAPPLLSVSIHYGVIRFSDANPDRVPRADDLGNYKRCRRDDIVLNRMRAFQGGIGRAAEDGIVSPDYAVLRPTCRGVSGYLNHLLRSPWFVGRMESLLRGIGGVEQGNVRTPRVNWNDLRTVTVPSPPLNGQIALAERLDLDLAASFKIQRVMDQQLELIREHRQALITAAVTGQLGITEAA